MGASATSCSGSAETVVSLDVLATGSDAVADSGVEPFFEHAETDNSDANEMTTAMSGLDVDIGSLTSVRRRDPGVRGAVRT